MLAFEKVHFKEALMEVMRHKIHSLCFVQNFGLYLWPLNQIVLI